MKHFRLNLWILLLSIVGFTAAATVVFCRGKISSGILLSIAVGAAIGLLVSLIRRLIGIMATYVSGLEMNDTTMIVEAGGDTEMQKMAKSMNRIAHVHRSNMLALETRKLYYDRILKIMTHEMRNAITPVISIAADMESNPETYSGKHLRECASLIQSQGAGIKRFLDSYYNLTHLPELNVSAVKAGDFFEEVMVLVDSELKDRSMPSETIIYTIPADMEMLIDSALMKQVMLNLLRNALDAISGKEDGRVEVILTVSESRPYLTVTDNGSGIAPEIMENLFQPFLSTKEGGSGIGLCLCRQIVRRHGGDLCLQTHPSHGTTAILKL